MKGIKMAQKKDFSADAKNTLGLRTSIDDSPVANTIPQSEPKEEPHLVSSEKKKRGRKPRPKRSPTSRHSLELYEENLVYLENIMKANGLGMTEALNLVLDDHRKRKEKALLQVLQSVEEKRNSWLEE